MAERAITPALVDSPADEILLEMAFEMSWMVWLSLAASSGLVLSPATSRPPGPSGETELALSTRGLFAHKTPHRGLNEPARSLLHPENCLLWDRPFARLVPVNNT